MNYSLNELQIVENLSVRCINVCKRYSFDSISKIIDFHNKNGNFKSLENCGLKTCLELNQLVKKYKKITLKNQTTEDNDFSRLKFFCIENFKSKNDEIELFRKSYIENKFPYIKFIDLILSTYLKKREYLVLKIVYFNEEDSVDKEKNLKYLKITPERFRQIINSNFKKIQKVNNLILNFSRELLEKQDLSTDLNENYIIFNNKIIRKNFPNYYKKYKLEFIGINYYFALSDKFSLIQNIKKIKNTFFLINNDIIKTYNFEGFIDFINQKYKIKRKNELICNSDEILKKFLITTKLNSIHKEICNKILILEYGMEQNQKGNILLKINKYKTIFDSVKEILQKANKPLLLDEIIKEISILNNRNYKKESVRSCLLLRKNEIISIGKTSTYALKEWGNIEKSTIRQLVKNYLNKFDEPKHIKDIYKFVLSYRNTNINNIVSNLYADKSGEFILFKKGYYGLKSKTYKNVIIKKSGK